MLVHPQMGLSISNGLILLKKQVFVWTQLLKLSVTSKIFIMQFCQCLSSLPPGRNVDIRQNISTVLVLADHRRFASFHQTYHSMISIDSGQSCQVFFYQNNEICVYDESQKEVLLNLKWKEQKTVWIYSCDGASQLSFGDNSQKNLGNMLL